VLSVTFRSFVSIIFLNAIGAESDDTVNSNNGATDNTSDVFCTVSANVSARGAITPSPMILSENESTIFTISVDSGFEINVVSGGNGALSLISIPFVR
jgi:hypothetical protein